MSDLFWPGDDRAGDLMSGRALVRAMVDVERSWYAVLGDAAVAPPGVLPDLEVGDDELQALAVAAGAGGNPVIPLVALLRARAGDPAAVWLHRGLTSQDVLDTAFMLLLRDVFDRLDAELAAQTTILVGLSEGHRRSICAARTLTQHAVPTTFGLIAADWLDSVVAVSEEVAARRHLLPAQVGGAGGTLAAIDLLTAGAAAPCAQQLADRLQLARSRPWHSRRRPVTLVANTLAALCDTWGRIANDVLLRTRPEIGELREGTVPGRGGSSTMPHKQNPVLSVLVRRAALEAPTLAAAVHAAAAAAVDQRSDGAWHAEWSPLRTLARRTAATASVVTELLGHLEVDTAAMSANATASYDDLLSEARSMAALAGVDAPTELTDYLGENDQLIEDAVRLALGGHR